ncbi:ATP-binding protein [Phytohabitans houttuyneae]|jgi:anti-sigma regulatory factor (Ser/Thr protein kinase)|uniref:Histidine kinase/HSP90-like ATPase domain-containing protein n=1 Tax=Phytohabitans houttuyneae TaxID=1076126 RepID=A0A6V8KAJ6_9ACTN|nr:ATP-binding protein [Phytohabitans houttuyneae]GFJ78727.1 hypothetical protein Phou_029070 [Phytohabitans houttuyneae]
MQTKATTPAPEHWLSLELEPRLEAAQMARELVATACASWHRESLAEPANIAISELVNNAVLHAGTPLTVQLATHREELLIAVRDGSTEPLRPRTPAHTSSGGRGLLLLDAIAASWGCAVRDGGKVVWAVLR